MKLDIVVVVNAADRVATADEIRSAISLLSGRMINSGFELVCEIPADTGGYVRISGEDLELLATGGADPAWADYQEFLSNISM